MTHMNSLIKALDQLPLYIAELAINNANAYLRELPTIELEYTTQTALFNAFVWSDTPQGGEFWSVIYESLRNPQSN